MSFVRLLARDAEPMGLVVTGEECLRQCRVDDPAEAAQLLVYAAAAQAYVEREACVPLTPRLMEAGAACWPERGSRGGWRVWVREPQVISAIEYVDDAGAVQVLDPAAYLLRRDMGLMHVVFRGGFELPAVDEAEGITLRFTAGYPAGACDPHLKLLVLALTEHFNGRRSAEMTGDAARWVQEHLTRNRLLAVG